MGLMFSGGGSSGSSGSSGFGATLATADQGYFFSNGILVPSGAGGNVAVIANPQEVRAIQFVSPISITLTRVTSFPAATVAASTYTVGIYSADKATKLLEAQFNGASGSIQTITVSSLTLNANTAYWFAQSASTQTTLTVPQAFAPTGNSASMMNAQTNKKFGLAANTATGAVLPASLGAITALSYSPILALFEP